MKQFILLLVSLLLLKTVSAQWSNSWLNSSRNKHLLYANGDLMVGNSSGGNLGMSFVYDCRYSFEFGYSAISNKFSTPISSLKSSGKKSVTDELIPTLMMENFNIMAGRHFNLNENKTIRFVLQGGPGMSVMIEWINKMPDKNLDGSVQGELTKTKTFSLMVNSKFEFPVTDLLGFSAGPALIFNHDKSYLTFNVGFMYGIITKN
jgi:hypothetical protein